MGYRHPGAHLRLHPLQCNRCAEIKKCSPSEKQIKTPEKELSDEEVANLSDAKFRTLLIRMLTEITEFGCKMKEEMKAMQSEIKNIYRE